MEENVSPELSLAPEPEQSQDHMDSCSQAVEEEEKQFQERNENATQEKILEKPEHLSKATSEVKKTWGFRQTTIAKKREMPGETASESQENRGPVRRSGRQPKRTDKLEEFLSTTKRGGRKSAPPSIESGDPPSQTPTDAETASEASFDGNADTKAVDDKADSPERRTRSCARKQTRGGKTRGGRRTRSRGGGSAGGSAARDGGSSENEEDGDTVNKPQVLQDEESESKEKNDPCSKLLASGDVAQPPPELDSDKKEVTEEGRMEQDDTDDKVEPRPETEESDEESDDRPPAFARRGPIRIYVNKKRVANKNAAPVNKTTTVNKTPTAPLVVKTATPVNTKAMPAAPMSSKSQDEEEGKEVDEDSATSTSSSSSTSDSDGGGYDPNALYCICRQKHNKRFMICCDRCEEWFHGDCVGITEARGRLMERNGEDYVCPNCTVKKSQVVKPATASLASSTENGKPRADGASTAPAGATLTAVTTTEPGKVDPVPTAASQAVAGASAAAASDEKVLGEDPGIKGRIEKAINPTGKKRIKIFQPQATQQTLGPKAKSTAEPKAVPVAEQVVASNVELNTIPVAVVVPKAEQTSIPKAEPTSVPKAEPTSVPKAEPTSVPKAEPTSVPKAEPASVPKPEPASVPKPEPASVPKAEQTSVPKAEQTSVSKAEQTAEESSLPKCIGPGCEKDAQPDSVYCGSDCILRHAAAAMKSITDIKEPKAKGQKKAGTKSAPKRTAAGRKKARKKSTTEEEVSDSEEDADPEPGHDGEDETAVEEPPTSATASWSCDHNYNAVTPEKTSPIAPTVLNKKCMYLFEGLDKSIITICLSSH